MCKVKEGLADKGGKPRVKVCLLVERCSHSLAMHASFQPSVRWNTLAVTRKRCRLK